MLFIQITGVELEAELEAESEANMIFMILLDVIGTFWRRICDILVIFIQVFGKHLERILKITFMEKNEKLANP